MDYARYQNENPKFKRSMCFFHVNRAQTSHMGP
jgi:hypothetical protein